RRRRLALAKTGIGERDVAPSGKTPLAREHGLTVTEDEQSQAHDNPAILSPFGGAASDQCFSANTFCAARIDAPKSTGRPSSASTCSSADNAMTTSNSAAYPMCPRRKSCPFISPWPPAIVMLCVSEYAATIFLLFTPRRTATAISAGLGVARALSPGPDAPPPARVARARPGRLLD